MSSYFRHPLVIPALLLAAAAIVMATVFYFQFGMGLAPCHLCYIERIPYYGGIAGLVIVLGLHAPTGHATPYGRALLALVGLGFLIGAGIAAYHVGVEQKWWPGPDSCTGSVSGGSLDDAVDRLLAAPLVRCDEIVWSLFGISMAGYNVLVSLGLGGCALAAARAMGDTGRQQ